MRSPRFLGATLGLGAILGSAVLSGCAALSEDDPGDDLRIATAFYPLQFVSERVVGTLAEVDNLTQPGAEPHDLALTIRETAVISRADLVVHEPAFQPTVEDSIEQNATGEVIDVGTAVELRTLPDGEVDPHFWHDPLRMATLGEAVAERMAEIDPDNADAYTSNAADLRLDLESLDTDYRSTLSDCERTTVVVSHDAFGYLEGYGIELAPVAGLSPDAEPTAADLARLQELIRADGTTTVFTERLASPRLTQSLARDMGIETAVLDPIEGLTDETTSEDYISLMQENLSALTRANGCES